MIVFLDKVEQIKKHKYFVSPKNKSIILNQNFNTISFGYNLAFKNYTLPCPTCGKKMMSYKLFTKFEKQILIAKNTKETLDIISNYGKYLHKTEKECLNILKKQNQIFPKFNLQELLLSLEPEHSKMLTKIQLGILHDINNLSRSLPFKHKIKLIRTNYQAKKMILQNKNNYNTFKRKIWLNNISGLTENINNKTLTNKIHQKALSFPKSGNNISAFILKYSQRDSIEIAKRFLSNSIVSIDHIVPKSKNGKKNWTNYIPKCRDCNSSEGDLFFYKRIINNPEIIKNIQIFFDKIIGMINAGKKVMDNYYNYPLVLANKFKELSKDPRTNESLVNIDISHLKSKEWIKEHKKSHAKF